MAQAVDSIASCASTSGGRKVISNDRRLVRLKADGENVSIANATRRDKRAVIYRSRKIVRQPPGMILQDLVGNKTRLPHVAVIAAPTTTRARHPRLRYSPLLQR